MPFFEEIGKKFTTMSQTAVEKTKSSTETFRLNNQIREEQHRCKELYQQLGQQYAQQYDQNPDPAFAPLMDQLKAAQERIASYQEQIQSKKTAATQQPVYPAGGCCPACGAALAPDAKFCVACGAKVEPEQPQPEPVASAPVVCPKCGQTFPADTKFCPQCGEKIS